VKNVPPRKIASQCQVRAGIEGLRSHELSQTKQTNSKNVGEEEQKEEGERRDKLKTYGKSNVYIAE
jgi:hypothetical protein